MESLDLSRLKSLKTANEVLWRTEVILLFELVRLHLFGHIRPDKVDRR